MGKLIEHPAFRNRHQLFAERREAGRFLSTMLDAYRKQKQTIVLAIPSGGVPVGLELASHLRLPLDLLITRKLQVPGNTESGFGAMTLAGRLFINETLRDFLQLNEAQIREEVARLKIELERRNTLFRNNRPPPGLQGKTAVLTDDGLASGYTMLAAADMAVEQGARRVVVAVPTAPLSSINRILSRVDELYCANVQDYGAFAVAAAYRHWRDLESDEVMDMLRPFNNDDCRDKNGSGPDKK